MSPFALTSSGAALNNRLDSSILMAVTHILFDYVALTTVVFSLDALFAPHRDPSVAAHVFGICLPIFTCAVLFGGKQYATNTIRLSPGQVATLIKTWLEAFGAAVFAGAVAMTIAPVPPGGGDSFAAGTAPALAITFTGGFCTLFLVRLGWMTIQGGLGAKAAPRVLYIGALDRSRRVVSELRAESSIKLVAAFDYRDPALAVGSSSCVEPHSLDRFAALLRNQRVDALLVALPQVVEDSIDALAAAAKHYGVPTLALPVAWLRRDLAEDVSNIGRLQVLRYGARAPDRFAMLTKRAVDIVFGTLILVALAPVMLLIAMAIRLDTSGPILFRQIRTGRHGHPFRILKFRTMVDEPISASRKGSGVAFDFLQTQRDDCRITRIGGFLRRHSLDELPQIFNVLRGDMSIIGPRPHANAMTVRGLKLETLVPEYPARFAMRPGITGWAQVQGSRGIIDTEGQLQDRVDHDLYYVENWSLGLDLNILLRTIRCLFGDARAF